jgi:uncharacterized phage protein (TIGR01671 family)
MRELRFRAWDETKKLMLTVNDIAWDYRDGKGLAEIMCINPSGCEYDPFEYRPEHIELLQFTGLLDRNGVEIYEGDIIHSGDNEDLKLVGRRGYVVFEDGCFEVERREHKVPWNHDKYLPYLDWPSEAFELCKVIGNVYENVDLLKTKED